jgi:hypothetical protein
MTKTQQIAQGLRALGWTEDKASRVTKGTVWKDGDFTRPNGTRYSAGPDARIFTSKFGTARHSMNGKKGESVSMLDSQLARIIAAGK